MHVACGHSSVLLWQHCNIRYVLPVLRMTSCFYTIGPVGRIKHNAMLSPDDCTSWTSVNYSVWLSLSECGTGSKICCLRLPCWFGVWFTCLQCFISYLHDFYFQELDLDINPKPLVFILHSFLAAKLSRLGLAWVSPSVTVRLFAYVTSLLQAV